MILTESKPLLFDRTPARPSTRDIARAVKKSGSAAGDDFSSVILVKTIFVEVLRREFDRPSWRRDLVALGTATDPYQPIEGHYKLTRGSLEALCDARSPVGLITKGPMIVRDRDVLVELGRRARCTVYFSVPTVDEDAWRVLEPGTAHPLQRLRAVRELVDAGVNAGVLIAPIVPGVTSQPARLERTIKAVADHGAAFLGTAILHLKDGTRTHFLEYLARELPHLVPTYKRLYAGAYAPKHYAREIQGVVRMLQTKYGMGSRSEGRDSVEPVVASQPRQRSFGWESADAGSRSPADRQLRR